MSCAAWPDDVASAPNPPSSDAILSSKAAVVGLPMRRVDVSEVLQGEEVGGVLGILENERGRGIDGHRPGAGLGIGSLSGVYRHGCRTRSLDLS